jgi:hypothetical protein
MPFAAVRPTRTLAFGAWLAARGPLAIASFGLAALGAAISVAAAMALRRAGDQDVALVPTLASECIAWSAGVMLAFGAALRAFHGAQEQGIVALVQARCAGLGAYVRGRVGGLVVVLALTLGGAALTTGIAAMVAGGATKAIVRSIAAALAYTIAFAATIGPVSMACLTRPTRVGGYLTLLAVLIVPELASPWTSALLPLDWQELRSIPAALSAVRECVLSSHGAGARAARAVAGLTAVFAVSVVVIARRAGRMAAEAPP